MQCQALPATLRACIHISSDCKSQDHPVVLSHTGVASRGRGTSSGITRVGGSTRIGEPALQPARQPAIKSSRFALPFPSCLAVQPARSPVHSACLFCCNSALSVADSRWAAEATAKLNLHPLCFAGQPCQHLSLLYSACLPGSAICISFTAAWVMRLRLGMDSSVHGPGLLSCTSTCL